LDTLVKLLMMKINRHGQAKILTQSEIQLLFSQRLQTERDSTLLGSYIMKCLYHDVTSTVLPQSFQQIHKQRDLCSSSRNAIASAHNPRFFFS
jgi:hypothetical protein